MNTSRTLLINLRKFTFTFKRTYDDSVPKPIKYYGFDYYPRTHDFKDPPYTPSKLFLIRRIKRMRHLTPEQREALETLNIDGETKYNCHINIVKNLPQINALLWKVKHLVDIKPIKWSGELPETEDFVSHLRDTGELKIVSKLKTNEKTVETSKKIINEGKKLNRFYLNKYLRAKWMNPFYAEV